MKMLFLLRCRIGASENPLDRQTHSYIQLDYAVDDDYGNNGFGKHDYEGEPLEGGAITPRPPTGMDFTSPTVWQANLKRKELFKKVGDSDGC